MVQRTPDVPVWPGPPYAAKAPYSQHSHHKSQTFVVQKGYALEQPPIPVDSQATPSSCIQASPAQDYAKHQQQQRHELTQSSTPLSRTPKWIENDGKVLRWYGYFKEAVPESPRETHRVRRVVFHYYLVDDTMDVEEPRQLNSGIDQGILLKRHRIPGPSGCPVAPEDMRIGQSLTVYGRIYFIAAVDGFTRQYHSQRGICLAPDEKIPACPYDAWLAKHNMPGSPMRSSELTNMLSGIRTHSGSMSQFENSGKVLRFFCVWDDRRALFGDRRPYRLHYFLEDGSCEILETREANSGREPFPVFLRRGPLPKNEQPVRSGDRPGPDDCVKPQDLRIGTTLTVYGRSFLIHDCDAFTQKWLQENLGFSAEELVPLNVRDPLPEPISRQLPVHNGFGSLEDSAQNCISLVPRPPRKDFYKLMNRDHIVLRFACRLVEAPGCTLSESDRKRVFVLSCFLADDSLAVFEPVVKNSGIIGGKYLERRQVLWPGSERVIKDTDLYVGAVLPILKRSFQLLDADEFTYQYMENNRHSYPVADADYALNILAAAIKTGPGVDTFKHRLGGLQRSESGYASASQIESLVRETAPSLNRHQALAILRQLQMSNARHVPVEALVAALQL